MTFEHDVLDCARQMINLIYFIVLFHIPSGQEATNAATFTPASAAPTLSTDIISTSTAQIVKALTAESPTVSSTGVAETTTDMPQEEHFITLEAKSRRGKRSPRDRSEDEPLAAVPVLSYVERRGSNGILEDHHQFSQADEETAESTFLESATAFWKSLASFLERKVEYQHFK